MTPSECGRFLRNLTTLAGCVFLTVACVDDPLKLAEPPPRDEALPSFSTHLTCIASVAEPKVSCGPTSGATIGADSDANHNLIVGGQDQFVRLATQSVSIDNGIFEASVTVQNLTLQPFATTDGATPSNRGVRVVFTREPSNGVVVKDPDGSMPLLDSSPNVYYQYAGNALGGDGILSQGETSQPKTWRFELNGATEFEFSVLVRTSVPDPVGVGVHLTGLTAGATHTCGMGDDGNSYCWGNNEYGQAGDGVGRTPLTVPTRVAAPAGVSFSNLNTKSRHTCADGSDGKLYCWGMNWDGQLGYGRVSYDSIPDPRAVLLNLLPAGITLSRVVAGSVHSCAHGGDGKIYCWGKNPGTLGDGTNQQKTAPSNPIDITLLGGVTLTEVVLGSGDFTCAWGSDNRIYCTGMNQFGQHGDGTTGGKFRPATPVAADGINAVALTLGFLHACLLDDAGKAYCWGKNGAGELGNGTNDNSSTPVPVQMDHLPGVTFTRIAAGFYHTCAEASNGKLYCWGDNQYGQLGDGTATHRNVPTEVETGHLPGVTLSGAALGQWHTCALGSDGRSYCWGYNQYGQLGVGYASTSIPVPTPVAGTRAPSIGP